MNDAESPPKESISQPIGTSDSVFYPDDPSPSLGAANIIRIDEEYVNPGPAEKSMLKYDLEELETFIDEPEEESPTATPILRPTLSLNEDGLSQETASSQSSSFPLERSFAPSSSVLNTFFPDLCRPKLARAMKKKGFYSVRSYTATRHNKIYLTHNLQKEGGGQWIN